MFPAIPGPRAPESPKVCALAKTALVPKKSHAFYLRKYHQQKDGSGADCIDERLKRILLAFFARAAGAFGLQQRENGRFRGSREACLVCSSTKTVVSRQPRGASCPQQHANGRLQTPSGGVSSTSDAEAVFFRQLREAPRPQATRERPFFRHPTPHAHPPASGVSTCR